MDPLVIPQQLLREYRECSQREQAVRQEKEAIRFKIVQLARIGARAERGPLGFHVVRSSAKCLTKAKVIQAVGWDEYEALAAAIEPTIQERLTVFPVSKIVASTVVSHEGGPSAPGADGNAIRRPAPRDSA